MLPLSITFLIFFQTLRAQGSGDPRPRAKHMERLETALMTVIWQTILERFNATSLSLQKVEIDLLCAVKLYDSLVTFLLQLRLRERFDEMEEKAKSYVDIEEYREATKRTKRRKRFYDETSTSDTELTARDRFRVDVFYSIVDCLVVELRKRMSAYSAVHGLFGFLTEFESLTPEDLRKHAAHLVESYPEDLEPSFVDEFAQFTDVLVADNDKTVSHMSELLKADKGIMLSTFLSVAIALRMYLTLPINNCEGERSFSTLTRVKNHLRSTMAQERLTALSLLCIESDVLRQLDCTELIDNFAQLKCRRRDL